MRPLVSGQGERSAAPTRHEPAVFYHHRMKTRKIRRQSGRRIPFARASLHGTFFSGAEKSERESGGGGEEGEGSREGSIDEIVQKF